MLKNNNKLYKVKDKNSNVNRLFLPSPKEAKINDVNRNFMPSENVIANTEKRIVPSIKTIFKRKNYTLGDALSMWMKSERLQHKASTEIKYEYLIEKHILPELGKIKLKNITSALLNDFIYKKTTDGILDGKGGLSASYVRTMAIIIQSAVKFATNEKICDPMNISAIKPKLPRSESRVLSSKEYMQLEACLREDMDETKLGIYISLCTGLRIGEICALKWEDINIEEKIIHIRATVSRVKASPDSRYSSIWIIDTPKTTMSVRDIPIPSKLYPILIIMKKAAISPFVASDNYTFISPRTYEYRYHKILKKYNLRHINYHILRHSFATRCIEVGMDVKTLSEILGHANVSITMNTYVHSSMELKRKQIEKVLAC